MLQLLTRRASSRGSWHVLRIPHLHNQGPVEYAGKNFGVRGYGRLRSWSGGDAGKFAKRYLKKIAKMHYFSIFFKKSNKPCVNFSRFWTKNKLLGNFEKILKIFDENSIEKLKFYLFWGKVVAKNIAFGNNILFLDFFRFGGEEG